MPSRAFNSVRDHVLHAAEAHIDRVILEAFVAGIDACADEETREILGMVCDLYALCVMEDDKAWFIEHRFLSTERAKAVTRGINDRCKTAAPPCRAAGRRLASPSSCATPRCCIRSTYRPEARLPRLASTLARESAFCRDVLYTRPRRSEALAVQRLQSPAVTVVPPVTLWRRPRRHRCRRRSSVG